MGRHAREQGLWFNPLPWAFLLATALFLLLFLRHVPCVQTVPEQEVDLYALLCYSDIQTTFLSQGWGTGASPLGAEAMMLPPLVAAAVFAARWAGSAVFGAAVGPGATLEQQIDASVTFFAITAVGLFTCFLAWVACTAWLGRREPGRTSWDALLVAGSPIVLAAGLISWDLLPIALTALGLAQLARGRTPESGIMLGLAACAGTLPLGVIVAVAVAIGLSSGGRRVAAFLAPAVATVVGVQLPLVLGQVGRVLEYYRQVIDTETGYGSLWYLVELTTGFSTRAAGSLALVALLLILAVFFSYLYVTYRRPRVESLVAVFILLSVLLAPSFTPQTSLWVLFAVVLARPYRPQLVAITITHVAYYVAIWGWLGGWLTSSQNGPYTLYWLAILARAAVDGWILVSVVYDTLTPRTDRAIAARNLPQAEELVGYERPMPR